MKYNISLLKVITDNSLKDYQGFNLAVFDDRYLEVSPHVEVFKAPKIEKVSEFKKQLMDHYKLEANQLRLWYIQTRQNKTNRVTQCLTSAEDKLRKDIPQDRFVLN